MGNDSVKQMALDLLRADSEEEAIAILKRAKLWDDPNLWRLYGDKPGNWAAAGNQGSFGEAALVEKITNSVDSRLLLECALRSIDPKGDCAPSNLRDAVAMFFEGGKRVESDEGGTLLDWTQAKRTEESRRITIAATGDTPKRGQRSKRMCLTIVDQAEGQSALRIPQTILSLNAENKQRIRFVQGKFNMGGSGALRFCGNHGLQLVITKRHPTLAERERNDDPSVGKWAVTIVRREEPSKQSGEPIHSEFTYLAPLGADARARNGDVLCFDADSLPLMPTQNEAYSREIQWGTSIKLYEYKTSTGQSNVLMKDGLLYALERLLPEIALPIRIYECRRDYKGKEGSFETPLSGLVVRLQEGKGDNLERGFPRTARLRAAGMDMRARIYAFKEGKAATYLATEGVIFTINGQAHGHIPRSIFSRPKSVGLSTLKDSLLVLVDCSGLSTRQREDLFMPSRDRLSREPIRYEVEGEIESMLKHNVELKRLQQERKERDLDSALSEEKPLEEVLGKVLKASPTLKTLFLQGRRLSRPFAGRGGGQNGEASGRGGGKKNPFQGLRHPTFFKFQDIKYGTMLRRNCEHGRRVRVKLVTDVDNEYFDRATDRGFHELETLESPREVSDPNYTLTLEDGTAILNMALPPEIEAGDELVVQATVADSTLQEPFVNVMALSVMPKQSRQSGGKRRGKKYGSGSGNDPARGGIQLPKIVPVQENDKNWGRYKFDHQTACHVTSDEIELNGSKVLEHVFYINIDNASLKTEMKYSKQHARVLQAKFKYGNVLFGLALLHDDETAKKHNCFESTDENGEQPPVQDQIRSMTAAVAPVLIPMIDQLSGLNEDQLAEFSVAGEDE